LTRALGAAALLIFTLSLNVQTASAVTGWTGPSKVFDGRYRQLSMAAEPAAPQTTLGLACRIFRAQAQGHLGDFDGCRLTVEAALATTEAEDPNVLEAARNALVVAYNELGIPLESLDRFTRVLNPTRVARRPDPGVREVSYENEGMKDVDDPP